MTRMFVMTESFDADWDNLKLSDDDLSTLQGELIQNPKVGSVMRGAGGFRKMRFMLPGRGKSGGLRVIYLDVQESETLYLLMAYPKSVKDTLTAAEKAKLKEIAASIKRNLRNRN